MLKRRKIVSLTHSYKLDALSFLQFKYLKCVMCACDIYIISSLTKNINANADLRCTTPTDRFSEPDYTDLDYIELIGAANI